MLNVLSFRTMKKTFLLLVFFYACYIPINAQDIGVGDPDILSVRKKEWDVYATIHTNGFGLGARIGKQNTIHLRSGMDMEFTYFQDLKEQRGKTSYTVSDNENKSFVFGKLNNFFQLRVGYGLTRIINTKPYWEGMSTGYFLYGGASLGFSVPVYLKIIRIIDTAHYEIVSERYDPSIHDLSNIYGGASFSEGLSKITLHPGIYMKTGFSFDFSSDDANILALDFGVALDAYYPPVKIMAFTADKYLFITGFLTFHFGKRLTNYE